MANDDIDRDCAAGSDELASPAVGGDRPLRCLAFAACGESDEEKAQNQICDARDDIKAQVSELQELTLTTATTDKVKPHLNAIKDDFGRSPTLGAA